METQDKQNIKKKAFALSAIMNNEKLANALYDSWGASVGSTKKAKAKAILYSMKRASNIHDGQGGIGNWWQSNVVNPLEGVGRGIRSGINEAFDPNKSPMMPGSDAYNKSQEARNQDVKLIRGADSFLKKVGTGIKEETKLSGEKSLGANILGLGVRAGLEWPGALKEGGEFVGRTALGTASNVIYPWLQGAEWTGRVGLNTLGTVASIFGPIKDVGKFKGFPNYEDLYTTKAKNLLFENGKVSGADSQKKYYRVSGTDEVYDKASNTHITAEQAAEIPNFWNQVEEVSKAPSTDREIITVQGRKIYKDTGEFVDKTDVKKTQETSNDIYKRLILSGQDSEAAAYEAKWQTGFQPDIEAVNAEMKKDPKTNPEFGKSVFDGMPQEEKDALYNNLDSSEQDFWRDSYEVSNIFDLAENAYELGLGSKTFAWSLLQDKEKLAKALGLPKEQAAGLPEGLLSEQLNDLRDTIDKKYKIEDQLDNIFELQQRDLTITDDFKSYIKGKDEYLGEIDKLLDGAQTKIAHMDTSNPYVAQRMQMYVNYLTILQGRQNKRYIDFLDAGITKHKNDLDSATNTYNKNLGQANKEYQEMGAVTVESYNRMVTMLEDIYNNVESREDRQIKLEEYERWKIDAEEKSLNLVLQNQKLNAEVYGGGTRVEVNASTAKMFKGMYLTDKENDDGTLNFTTYNPYEVRSAASTAQQNDKYAVNSFMTDMGYTVNKSVGNGSLDQFKKFKESMTKNVASNVIDFDNLTKAEQEEYDKYTPEQKKALQEINAYNIEDLNTMYSKLQNNLRSGMQDYFSSTEEKIKELRNAIDDLSKKEGKWFGWGKINREDFVKKHSPNLSNFAGDLFDYTTQTLEANPSLKNSNDIWGDIPDDLLPQIVSESLTPYLML